MPPKPFVSVVTVSLNAAHTIADAIASVSLQETAFALEHICVDGGSVDETRSLIDAWAVRSKHIVRIYEPDTGIFDAMNKGLRAASGESGEEAGGRTGGGRQVEHDCPGVGGNAGRY